MLLQLLLLLPVLLLFMMPLLLPPLLPLLLLLLLQPLLMPVQPDREPCKRWLREFCDKSDAAFGGCGFFVGARRQSAPFRGVCVAYGKALLLVVSRAQSYGKIVTLRHPMVKPYPREVPTLAR